MSETQVLAGSGPHLSAAFLCERILIERDGVPSFIHVAERFTIAVLPPLPPGIPPPPIPPPVISTNLVTSLKAGDLKIGKYELTIKRQNPDGLYEPDNIQQIFFNGSEESGIVQGIQMLIASPAEGLYWFDIYFGPALLTRVPMRVLHQLIPIQFQQVKG
jgi:hypothetical protein